MDLLITPDVLEAVAARCGLVPSDVWRESIGMTTEAELWMRWTAQQATNQDIGAVAMSRFQMGFELARELFQETSPQ